MIHAKKREKGSITMDCLCEEDKNLQTVELLIRFINIRRADSIKEALQEYDKLMANRQLLEIEKQKLQAELQRTASEHADRMQHSWRRKGATSPSWNIWRGTAPEAVPRSSISSTASAISFTTTSASDRIFLPAF